MCMFILLIFLTLFTSVFASITDDIKTLVLKKNALTIDEVVTQLPEDLRKNFTLVYKGRALLQTSYEFPAAILFGKDGKVLLSFNGSPTHRGYSSLDVLEYNETSQEYKASRFLFSPSARELKAARTAERIGNTDVHYEPKPRTCMGCHGMPEHPIFESSYPEWKGFYGSERDHLYGTHLKPEIEGFERFRLIGKPTPRYQALIFPSENGSSMSPYMDEGTSLSAHEYRPNLVFGSYLVRTNAKTIFKYMKRSPEFEKYKALLTMSLQKCSLAQLDQGSITLIDGLAAKVRKDSQSLKLNSSYFLNPELHLNRSVAAKLISIMGISSDFWNLAVRGNGRSPEYGYWSGYGDTLSFVHAELIRDLFGVEMNSYYQEVKFNESFGDAYEARDQASSCDLIWKKFLKPSR